jgi:ribosomal protein S18 acetylase RimI-like enzyme
VTGLATWWLREAGASDAEALALISSATFLETFAGVLAGDAIIEHCTRSNGAPAYQSYLQKGARAWLAEADPGGAPVGFALLTAPDLPGALDDDIELKRIYTLSRFHGSGLGAALMEAAVAAAEGSQRLVLGVYAGNARAIAFYLRNGFRKNCRTKVRRRRHIIRRHRSCPAANRLNSPQLVWTS